MYTDSLKIACNTTLYAGKLGIESIKIDKPGWPHRVFLIPGGKPVFVMFKSLEETPSSLQYEQLNKLNEMGYKVIWVTSVDGALEVLKHELRYAKLVRGPDGKYIKNVDLS